MEQGRQSQTAYRHTTRVYSPTRGSVAYAYEAQAEVIAQPLPAQPSVQRAEKPVEKTQARQAVRPELAPGTKAALVVAILALALASLFVILRYQNIAAQYKEINALSDSIVQIERRIAELNVQLECAVNIDTAQEAARRLGLTYPEAKQYVAVGDALILAAEQPAADPGEPGGEPAQPDGAPNPEPGME